MIHIAPSVAGTWDIVQAIGRYGSNVADILLSAKQLVVGLYDIEVVLQGGNGVPRWDELVITVTDPGIPGDYNLKSQYANFRQEGNRGIFSGYIGDMTAGSQASVQVQYQTVDGNIDPTLSSVPQIIDFPLENIDEMRESILMLTRQETAYVIDEGGQAPYGMPFKRNDTDKLIACQYSQEGLALKTYQSDLFNNWISTEWIDGTNGINEITAVSTDGGSFSIDSLNLANKVYNMLNRIAISGGTYDDWLDAVYTHERSRSVENPVYQGSLIKELSFEEVISTADAQLSGAQGGQALGTLAGRGRLTGKNKGGKIKVKVDEPSYIMGIVSLTPRVDYSQGNKWDTNLKSMNDLHKPALDSIGYQDLITDQMAWFDTIIERDTEPRFFSAGKQPAWINYMTNVNQVRGNFADKNDSMFMTLNRRYESLGLGEGGGIGDLTTYIDPSKFNNIFADGRLDAQNFWVQISNKITARRKMSAKVIPNL